MERLLALSASAGSGKTFALVARYLALLFMDAKPSEILAITFTNKAAGEMRERLMASLEELSSQMAEAIARSSGMGIEEIEAKRPKVLRRFLAGDLRVMTIDKFIHQVLRKFCWYVGIESDFEIAATPTEEFFGHFLQNLDDRHYRELVDFARFEAQKRQNISDFFELLYEKEKELPPLGYSVEPYSDQEAMRWALRIKEYFQDQPVSERAKKTMDFETIDDVVHSKWFAKKSLNYWDYKKVYTPVVDEWFAELKREVAAYYRKKERFFLARIFALYDLYKASRSGYMRRCGRLYFKDIEHLVYELLRQKDFTQFLYFRLDARIGHILFDEFQDTSVTQYRIFEPIIEEIASGGSERTFFYVGDTKQSIYRFRGGQKALFDYVAKRFHIHVGHLDTNYRTGEVIVDFVNRTFPYVQPPQKAFHKGGYVEVAEGEPLEELAAVLGRLIDAGAADESIAVLVHDNKEILQVGDMIRERFGKEIATHKRAKVSEQPSAKAMIELMRLLYARLRGKEGSLHRLNFLTLIGRPYDPDFEAEIPLDRPAKMIKTMMERYALFDEAAMKLLEFAIPLHDLVEFIHEIDHYEEELPPREVRGINVLTIHKSKGLEFEHLIVLDRLGRSKSDTTPVIFDYEGIELKRVWMKFKNREEVDGEYAAALKRERSLVAEDRMNKIYVAFTRARRSLFVVKKEKGSIFDFLDLKPQTLGNFSVEAIRKPAEKESAPLTVHLRDYGRQNVPQENQRYQANDFEAIYLGQGVHYLFETEDEDAFLNRYGALCDVKKAKELVKAGRGNMEYLLLTEGKEIHELPYVFEGKEGIVDLFVDQGEKGVIIDYKTATPHDIRSYKEQLLRYKEALEALMPKKKEIDAYIYFLDTLKLVKVG
ncbi:RecB-like helicase [Hydrogenimonas urashimensis]|uniref:RecB-like helicase n=1 Tax=Hydrogenimonas urashimensis TaxID=2740515 RepID=UPI0019164370|nr:RecB-like helicase [Hydrogenimonas urashimensis]